MARYLETVDKLHTKIERFISDYCDLNRGLGSPDIDADMVVELGHIVNLAVRCNPRQSQGEVRRRIVAGAMKNRCVVTMTKEESDRIDQRTGRPYTFNAIHIRPK